MNKIPTLFVRDSATNRKHVLNEVTPGCEWVLDGEPTTFEACKGADVSHIHLDGKRVTRVEFKSKE